jgi:hypothetical protein
MFEDEMAGGDVVANDAGNGAGSVQGIADGRTDGRAFVRGLLYQPRNLSLEPVGCLAISCRKMCLLGSGPGVLSLMGCASSRRWLILISLDEMELRWGLQWVMYGVKPAV